jgi:hypothetical protein
MADVAAGVMHNIGNVLNSINVSTTTLTDRVRKSKVGGLARAADLLTRRQAGSPSSSHRTSTAGTCPAA